MLYFTVLKDAQQGSMTVYIEEGQQGAILKSVFDYGKISEYKTKLLQTMNPTIFADGVYLITISPQIEESPDKVLKVTNCLFIRDVIQHINTSYEVGMLDCDSYPDIENQEGKIEITPLRKGDLFHDVTRGIYQVEFPPNTIPGYIQPLKCFFITDLQGTLGKLTGYGGMSCDFKEPPRP